jgi:hypothetical protein
LRFNTDREESLMAGQPETKRRREREAAAAARRPVDPALKREALQLAEKHGPTEASRRTGVKAGTIRAWKARVAKAAQPRRSAATRRTTPGAVRRQEGELPATRAEALWADAERAREGSRQAEERGDAMLRKSRAAEARNAAVVATQRGERARQLEDDARAAEEHEAKLAETMGRLVLDLVGAVLSDVGLPTPTDLLRARLAGWPAEPDADVVTAAREEVCRAIRTEVRAELAAEAEAMRAARRALPPGEQDGASDDAEGGEPVDGEIVDDGDHEDECDGEQALTFDDLPAAWKARFATRPELGVYEYEQAELREHRRGGGGPRRVSVFARRNLEHPGLRGG